MNCFHYMYREFFSQQTSLIKLLHCRLYMTLGSFNPAVGFNALLSQDDFKPRCLLGQL